MARGQKTERVHVGSIHFAELPITAGTQGSARDVTEGAESPKKAWFCGVMAAVLVAVVVVVVVVVVQKVNDADLDVEDLSHVPNPPSSPPLV